MTKQAVATEAFDARIAELMGPSEVFLTPFPESWETSFAPHPDSLYEIVPTDNPDTWAVCLKVDDTENAT